MDPEKARNTSEIGCFNPTGKIHPGHVADEATLEVLLKVEKWTL
jgi:hypothetical protein